MAVDCTATNLPLVRGLLTTVDCNVGEVVRTGYGALAAPSGATQLALTAALTLFVALFGWRLMLGRTSLNVGDAAGAAIKIGVVLLLAGSWGTYQTLVYDTLYTAPAQLAASLMGSAQNAGSAFRGDPFDGLQVAVDQLQSNADFYAARAGTASPFLGGIAFGAMTMNGAAMLMLMSSAGLLIASKIVLALLLALAPAIAGLLLFDATRGMVEGWVRAMVTLALTPLSVTLLLALELALIEPSLAVIAENRAASRFDIAPATSIGTIALVFAMVTLATLISAAMIARGIRLPGARREAAPATAATAPIAASADLIAAPTRATRIAAAFEASARRAATPAAAGLGAASRRIDIAAAAGRPGTRAPDAVPLGAGYARAAAPRRSAARSRRDR